MPGLPSKSSKGKGPTPIIKTLPDDVWQRTLEVMGLELMSQQAKSTSASSMSFTPMPTPQPTAPSAGPAGSQKLTILDLPSETQKDIFKHASFSDLISLSLVSRHFRDLAAERLYRTFHIVFTDEDDPSVGSRIDGLAVGLETFATSDYDYAMYLREIILEAFSGGDKGERMYRHYLSDNSCGKFMNTLFLLTLRKAKALETFRWDIRVELSRPVFKALHQIKSLQHLHLRMQVGPSIYQPPPAIPASGIVSSTSSTTGINLTTSSGSPISSAPISISSIPLGFSNASAASNFPLFSKVSRNTHLINTKAKLPAAREPPPTLSGFRNLKTLSILDMDTLDYIDELRTCVGNSSATLSSLKLSFSESLANKSRKPPPEVQSDDDSDQEDEFGQLIPPPGPPPGTSMGASDPNGPSKVLKAQEEKKRQEAVMGRIFGVEPTVAKTKPPPPPKADVEKETVPEEDPKRVFIRNLAPVAAKLMGHVQVGSDITAESKETLAMIEKAAKLYIDSIEKGDEKGDKKEKEKEKTSADESIGSSTAKATPASSSASMNGVEDEAGVSEEADGPGLFDEPDPKKSKAKATSDETGVSNPDDIDIEEPEGTELAIEFGAPEAPADEAVEPIEVNTGGEEAQDVSISVATDAVSWANRLHILDHQLAIRQTHDDIEREGEKLKKRLEEFQDKLASGRVKPEDFKVITEAEADFKRVCSRVHQLSRDMQEVTDRMDDLKEVDKLAHSSRTNMSEYIRSTRGLALETLSIYLIPLRATILSRAIDLNVLKSITLLNVGPQIPFWNLLSRENKVSPLPLQKIHTDNVTLPFLAFVAQLDILTELFLLERTAKARVESTAAKTTVTIEQIRKVVLKRHADTLKILMIRNDASPEWDLNTKCIMLLCNRAKGLEELACSFGIRVMHTLLQFMPGLISLRVLHTIQFRQDDACLWVVRNFIRFAVDNISHHPDMKLEYIALDTSVERLVRRKPMAPIARDDKKGKGKAKTPEINSKALAELVIGTAPGGTWGNSGMLGSGQISGQLFDWQESDEEDGTMIGSQTGLKIETLDGIHFCDVEGVRIFEKDILAGKL